MIKINSMLPLEAVKLPLIAILRGITPEEVMGVVDTLYASDIEIIEVTMNSPQPIDSIKKIVDKYSGKMIIGAGTVLTPDEVEQVADIGARLIVSPNCNPEVIKKSKQLGMISVPGCLSPTEIFVALDAGADVIKLYPSAIVTPAVVRSYLPVLPKDVKLVVTGGIPNDLIAEYKKVGVYGLGLGTQLYKPGKSLKMISDDLKQVADRFQFS